MTSFGRGECTENDRTWTIEIRSVNHRYSDIIIKIARKYSGLEERIKKLISQFYSRGRIEVSVNFSGVQTDTVHLEPNIQLAREYYNCLKTIKNALKLTGEPDLNMLFGYKDIISPRDVEENLDEVWQNISKALTDALNEGMKMRQAEGKSLKAELLGLLGSISETVEEINLSVPALIEKKGILFKERLDNLLNGINIDPARLAQEIAILIDKTDVTEEITRLRSHIQQFTLFMDLDEPVGRRLDFLLQEFLREVNTIASKISDAPMAHKTVDLKNNVEKLREQVQNIE